MSLINIFLTSQKAIIAVDSQGYDAINGEFVNMGKMHHFPHMNVVMAGRGDQSLTLVLYTMLSQTYAANSFDSLAAILPEKFKATHQALNAGRVLPDALDRSTFDNQEILLVGWSEQEKRMRAFVFSQKDPADGIGVIEVEEPGYMIPWEDRWGEPPEGESPLDIVNLAREQTKNAKRDDPSVAMGGLILLAELTRHNMSFSIAGAASMAAL